MYNNILKALHVEREQRKQQKQVIERDFGSISFHHHPSSSFLSSSSPLQPPVGWVTECLSQSESHRRHHAAYVDRMWRETSKLREEEGGQQHDYQQQYRQNYLQQELVEKGREGEKNIEMEGRLFSEDKLCDFGEIRQPPPKRIRIESGNPLDIIESNRTMPTSFLPPSSSRTRDNLEPTQYCKRKRIKDEDDANGNESDSSFQFPSGKRHFSFSSQLAPHLADIEFH